MPQTSSSADAVSFARRLRHALKQAGLKHSATELAHAFNLRDWGKGVTPHATRNWLNGVSIPKQSRLMVLCELLQVSPHELLFGPQVAAEPTAGASQEVGHLGLADRCMWRLYHQLSVEHRRMVRELTSGLHQLEMGEAVPLPDKTGSTEPVPITLNRARA